MSEMILWLLVAVGPMTQSGSVVQERFASRSACEQTRMQLMRLDRERVMNFACIQARVVR